MKLFLVIYSGLNIGGSIGPLPYGSAQCWDHADKMTRLTRAHIESGLDKDSRPMTREQIEKLKALRFGCERRQARPELGEPA